MSTSFGVYSKFPITNDHRSEDNFSMPPDDGARTTSTGTKRSPWRFQRRPKAALSDTSTAESTMKKGLFSTPTRKLKNKTKKLLKKKKKKTDKKDNSDYAEVTVQVLPKSPFRNGGDSTDGEIKSYKSPPRILRPHVRTLETEEIFSAMFESYLMKYHNHKSASNVVPVHVADNTICCTEVSECSIPSVVRPSQSYQYARFNTLYSDVETNSLRVDESVTSSLTMPSDLRSLRHQTPGEVLSRFSQCVSEVTDALFPCSAMPRQTPEPTTGHTEDVYESESETDDEDSEEHENGDDNDNDDDDDDDSSGYSTSTSTTGMMVLIPEIKIRKCDFRYIEP